MLYAFFLADVVTGARHVTDGISEKSDRWLMIFMLVVIVLSALLAARWLATLVQTSLKEHITLSGQLKATMESQQACIERNTAAFTNVCAVIERNNTLITDIYKTPQSHV